MVFLLSYLGGWVQRVNLELDLTRVVAFSSKIKEVRRAREMRIQDLFIPRVLEFLSDCPGGVLASIMLGNLWALSKQNVMLFHSEKFSCIFFFIFISSTLLSLSKIPTSWMLDLLFSYFFSCISFSDLFSERCSKDQFPTLLLKISFSPFF